MVSKTSQLKKPARPIPADHMTKTSHQILTDQDDMTEQVYSYCDFTQVTSLQVDACRIERSVLSALRLQDCSLVDVVATKLEAAGMRAFEARLERVEFSNSRLSGVDFGGADIEDCIFSAVKFDEAGFKSARLSRVAFESCDLRNADFSNARLRDVTFTACVFDKVHFDNAICRNVDLTEQQFDAIYGLTGLRGATITIEQSLQLAPTMATTLGLKLETN